MTSRGLGGIQQSLVPYSLALQKLGCSIQVLVMHGAGILGPLSESGLDAQVSTLRPGGKLFRYLPHPGLRRQLAGFAPDLVIGFAQLGFFEAERAARPLGVPVVTRVGSMKTSRRESFSRADGWLATTPEMKDTLTAMGYPPERVYLVPNFMAEASLPRPGYALAAPPLVGSLGRFSERKGFPVLIDAIATLQERGVAVRCEIAGDGKHFQELERQIAARGAADYITLLGWLDKPARAEFLQRIDLFVSPSLDEPFGFVYLDAMHVGAPIITCPTVGARYIFSAPDSAEFVPPGDAPALADAIQRLLYDDERRRELGRNAERRYAARFGLDAGVRSLEQSLGAIVARGKK